MVLVPLKVPKFTEKFPFGVPMMNEPKIEPAVAKVMVATPDA
jgi:hypothetical protein